MSELESPPEGVTPRSSIGDEAGHFPLLRALKHKGNVSQRALADGLGMGTARVNRLLGELVDTGYLEVVDRNVRPFAYRLTEAGERYLRQLRHEHYEKVMADYRRVRLRIENRLREIRDEGLERVVLYGAGEVMEVAFPLAEGAGLKVVGIVDDNPDKHRDEHEGVEIGRPADLPKLEADGVVVTTFRHADAILERLDQEVGDRVRVETL